MFDVLSTLLSLTFAGLGALGWRVGRRGAGRVAPSALGARDHRAVEQLHALVDASRASSAAVLACLDRTLRAFDPSIDLCLVFVPVGDELHGTYAAGLSSEHLQGLHIRRDDDVLLPARAAVAGHRVAGDAASGALLPTDRRALAVPLRDAQGLRAVLYLASTDACGLADEGGLVSVVEHAVVPYAMAFERELDRSVATYDALTGLLTPRAFRARLYDESERPRINAVMSLWFIDTDHFKRVNDEFGHAAGDRVLQEMAELLRVHTVRDVDVIGRNGGDEFCALIREAQKTLAIERAQAYCEAVRTYDFGVPVRITASIGVAALPYDASAPSELLEVADAAMYHSKRLGRDRVSFAVNGPTYAVYR